MSIRFNAIISSTLAALIVFSAASINRAGAATFAGSKTVNAFCPAIGTNICNGVWRESAGLPPIVDPLDIVIETPRRAAGDGVFKFTAYGDFDKDYEYATVHIESLVAGYFLNSNPDDDLFSDDGFLGGAWADIGNEYGALRAGVCALGECVAQPPRTGSMTIAQADLNAMLTDGLFTVHVWVSKNVSDGPCCAHPPTQEYFTAELSFPMVADVPSPPALALFPSALGLIGALKRRNIRAG